MVYTAKCHTAKQYTPRNDKPRNGTNREMAHREMGRREMVYREMSDNLDYSSTEFVIEIADFSQYIIGLLLWNISKSAQFEFSDIIN